MIDKDHYSIINILQREIDCIVKEKWANEKELPQFTVHKSLDDDVKNTPKIVVSYGDVCRTIEFNEDNLFFNSTWKEFNLYDFIEQLYEDSWR